jgi:uncharacterized delta-60 repeat protein
MGRSLVSAAIVFAGVLVFAVGPAQAAPGGLDPSFGTGGILKTAVPGNQAPAVVLQPDGKIVVTGSSSVIRYKPDGSLDSSFGTGGVVTRADTHFNALALQPDGKILVAGFAFNPPIPGVFELERYLPDGSLDPSFGSGGVATTRIFSGYQPEIGALALQADGKIIAAGGDGARVTVARYLPDGSLDTSFGPGGIVTTTPAAGEAQAVAVQSDGKIVVAGSGWPFADYGSIVRYRPDGSLDPSFATGGIVATPLGPLHALVLQPDGKILVGGGAYRFLSQAFGVARYNPDGSPDLSFGTGGETMTDAGWSGGTQAIALQPDGDIVAAGQGSPRSVTYSNSFQFALVRYHPDGALDTGFGACGRAMTAFSSGNGTGALVDGLALQPDGKILAAGRNFDGSKSEVALARYLGGNAQGNCHVLRVTFLGEGDGWVWSDPSGLDCGTTCAVPFPAGTSVSLSEVGNTYPTAPFGGWGGECSGTGACRVTMDRDRSVTATFLALCRVPDVTGKRLGAARMAITSAHCSVGKVKRRFSRKVRKGRVISQVPAPAAERPLGAKVKLVVSKGKRRGQRKSR